MDLITQIQGMGYSFVYGIIFTFVYHFIYSHLIKIKIKFIYFIMQGCFGIIFAAIYFIGLLKINEGILRAYFLVSVLAGYVVYQNLMHEKMYIMIVKINQKLTRLFKCQRHIRMFWFNAYTVQLRNGLHRFSDYAIKRNC